jgi:predicted transcriptional regulator
MKDGKKGMLITLDTESKEYLRSLAERNSSSMSYEVRRLIKDEQRRNKQGNSGNI